MFFGRTLAVWVKRYIVGLLVADVVAMMQMVPSTANDLQDGTFAKLSVPTCILILRRVFLSMTEKMA